MDREEREAVERMQKTDIYNATWKVKREVIDTLERTLPEIKLYLNRPSPNIQGAMERVKQIEEMVKKLHEED